MKAVSRYRYRPLSPSDNLWPLSDATVPGWFAERRTRARENVRTLGLPTQLLERWKYTKLPPLAVQDFQSITESVFRVDGSHPSHAVRLQEMIAADRVPAWVRQALCAPAPGHDIYGDMMLWDLAHAGSLSGVVVDVPEGMRDVRIVLRLEAPSGACLMPHVLVRTGGGAVANIELHVSTANKAKINMVTNVRAGERSVLRIVRVVEGGAGDDLFVSQTHLASSEGSETDIFTYAVGHEFRRDQFHAELQEKNSSICINGINIVHKTQVGDATILVEHQAPSCRSSQFYRNVADGRGRGIFQGKIHVHKQAQQTDGYQLSRSLVLSEGAEMDTRPELEIYADDVKCSHGATTGQLDATPLFYLRSRGVPEQEAQMIMIEAFAREALEKITDEAMRNELALKLQEWLQARDKNF